MTPCPHCGTMLDENRREPWPEYLATATVEHADSRCLAVVCAQRDEARMLVNRFLDCDDVGVDELMRVRDTWGDTVLERLRHGK